MNALLYIVRKSMKNSLRELVKKPVKLIMYILVVAAIIALIVISIFVRKVNENPAPMFWFSTLLFLYITIFTVSFIISGLSGGSAIFEMSDVNLLFVSPVNPRHTLIYGIARMAKTAFLASFFILFQAGTLANFGIGTGGLFLTFAGFLLSTVALMALSLVIYNVTNSRPRRKLVVKCVTAAMFVPLAAFLVVKFIASGDITAALGAVVNSPFLRFIPVSGWASGGVTAFISGDLFGGFIYFGLVFLLGAAAIAYILLSNPDYYEDVLVATETAFEKKRALAEGNLGAATASQKAVRIKKTGISGRGAPALFSKHLRESFRQSRIGFFSLTSIVIIIAAIAAAYFIKNMAILLQILMWVQMFLIGTGLGLKETYSHYIYMIPESSFSKIVWSNMEIMARTLIESILIFGLGGLLAGAGFWAVLSAILVYTFYSLLLLGVNYFLMRLTGADMSGGILIMIYVFAIILALAPGIVGASVAGFTIGGDLGMVIGLLILAAWEFFAGLGLFALSGGILHNCDMASIKTDK